MAKQFVLPLYVLGIGWCYSTQVTQQQGMRLLARVVLIVLFSSIANTNTVAGPQLNLLPSLTSCGLISVTAAFKPYKSKLLNALEIFHLTILFILSSSNLYVSNIGTGIGLHAYICGNLFPRVPGKQCLVQNTKDYNSKKATSTREGGRGLLSTDLAENQGES